MSHSLNYYQGQYAENEKEILDDFFTYLRFESISTQKEFHGEAIKCAHWLSSYLKKMDLDVSLWETPSLPTLFATNLKAGPDKPTILIYLHYDVQPVDPLDLWDTKPFEPTVLDDNVYARGACDNKGQAFYTLTALKYILQKHKKYPVNLKIIIEGEEECGSAGLNSIIKEKTEELKADYLLIVDVDIPNEDSPTVNLGCRGICTAELTLKGTHTDLHSGLYGGVVKNPLTALCEIFAKFHDNKGRVTIPGFYEGVRKLSSSEKNDLYLELDENEFKKTHGVLPTGGEKAFLPLERMGLRPTFEINGLWGGYMDPGFKTVIPSLAHAKVSMRLVPDQDPYYVLEQFTTYIHSLVPDDLELILKTDHEPAPAIWCDFDSKIVDASMWAFTEVFQKPCKKYIGGGSLPIASTLQKASKAQSLCLGLAISTDQIHAPNEHFSLERFKKGFLILTQLIEKLGDD